MTADLQFLYNQITKPTVTGGVENTQESTTDAHETVSKWNTANRSAVWFIKCRKEKKCLSVFPKV